MRRNLSGSEVSPFHRGLDCLAEVEERCNGCNETPACFCGRHHFGPEPLFPFPGDLLEIVCRLGQKCLLNQAQNCLIDALECVDVLDLGEFQTIFSYTERLLDLPGPGGITLL